MDEQLMDMMYNFEHLFLPRALFSNNQDLIDELRQSRDAIYILFNDICVKMERDNPFFEEEFNVRYYQMDNNWSVIHVFFPPPPEPYLCYGIYFFFDRSFGRKGCYALERRKDNEDGTESGLLCSWDVKGERHEHDYFKPERIYAPIERAYELHTEAFPEIKNEPEPAAAEEKDSEVDESMVTVEGVDPDDEVTYDDNEEDED